MRNKKVFFLFAVLIGGFIVFSTCAIIMISNHYQPNLIYQPVNKAQTTTIVLTSTQFFEVYRDGEMVSREHFFVKEPLVFPSGKVWHTWTAYSDSYNKYLELINPFVGKWGNDTFVCVGGIILFIFSILLAVGTAIGIILIVRKGLLKNKERELAELKSHQDE